MQALYQFRCCPRSGAVTIRSYYQSSPINSNSYVMYSLITLNKNFIEIINYRDPQKLTLKVANSWWQIDRTNECQKIETAALYKIMCNLKGDLKLCPKSLAKIKHNLASPYDFYLDFLSVFKLTPMDARIKST